MPVLGSIQVGSASRFSSKGKEPERTAFEPDVSNAQLESPPPPLEYKGLRVGPDFSVEYEAATAPAIDGSRDLSRVLSPFMIQVEPPLIMSQAFDTGGAKNIAGIFEGAHRGAPNAFVTARTAIQQDLPGGSQLSNSGTVESFVSQGFINRPRTKDRTIDVKGDGPSRLGTPSITDLKVAADITMQLRALVNTPPLVLLINPQTLNMVYTKIQQFSDRTRYGFVFQAWGEEQPRLSISARCGAFISGGRGVQWASRRDSAAWQNLATAFHFYRNNGYIYDTVGKSNANHMVGALSIHYDGWVYYGNMESFSYAYEEANQLGGVVFDMEFTVNEMVDTSKVSPVVTPMRSPIPSASDRRFSGLNGPRGTASPGDISVGADGVQVGGEDFYSRNDYTQRPGGVTPDGQPVTRTSPGLAGVASKSGSGFQAASATAAAPAASSTRLVPFGIRR